METERDDNGAPQSLDVTEITHATVRAGSLWREVRVVAETGSSNADVLAAAREGAREGMVLVAESQTAGRGRMGRRWTSPPRAGLTFSVLLRPYGVPAALLGWLPLLAGCAVAAAVPAVTAVHPRLKWPNDVLVGDAKLAGILAERSGSAVVVGIGINVFQRRDELPPGVAATSLLLEAAAGQGAAARRAGKEPRGQRRLAGAGPAGPICAPGCSSRCSTRCPSGTWPGGISSAPATPTPAGCARSTWAGASRSAAR